MKKLYLFDFDGTLTHKDTMFLFLKFYNPSRFYLQFAKHIPLFILLKMRLLDAEKVKKSFVSALLKGEKKHKIESVSRAFFDQFSPVIMRRNALDFLKSRDPDKTESYLVTASMDIWAKPFADQFGMRLIATQAEFRDDIFTGNFIGKNCNGPEKLVRIKSALKGKTYDKSIAFGDSSGDKAMLNWASESHFRFFH
ncbi:HAD family hydrolase [Chryseobacterium sp. MFBS3-17]|uniref:HAD family hydrolase n=1 Tax=Chryseobacterium sp. MFBS3-17 TaxID=2886689 RepID=UPI001D0E7084|nr:HAD family hydrolase [Chryseobacterium sp. MFBS3-17]MCC2590761.1 haloacid dehalogenase-like hydrolase [Chryseobacterium sp. MFBS3-17]